MPSNYGLILSKYPLLAYYRKKDWFRVRLIAINLQSLQNQLNSPYQQIDNLNVLQTNFTINNQMRSQKSLKKKVCTKDKISSPSQIRQRVIKSWPSFEYMRNQIMGNAKQQQVKLLYSLNCKEELVGKLNKDNQRHLSWTQEEDFKALLFYFDQSYQHQIQTILQDKSLKNILERYQFMNLQIKPELKQALIKIQQSKRRKEQLFQLK